MRKTFNNIEQSDPIFADLFADIDLYFNRLGTGDSGVFLITAKMLKMGI